LIALGPADQNPFSAGEHHPQRLAQATGPERALLVAGQRLAGGADRVDPIVLGSPGPLERPDLDDRLASLGEEHNQTGGETAGSFQRPDPAASSVLTSPGEHPPIPSTVSGIGQMSENATSTGVEHRKIDGVAVRVTSDDEVVVL